MHDVLQHHQFIPDVRAIPGSVQELFEGVYPSNAWERPLMFLAERFRQLVPVEVLTRVVWGWSYPVEGMEKTVAVYLSKARTFARELSGGNLILCRAKGEGECGLFWRSDIGNSFVYSEAEVVLDKLKVNAGEVEFREMSQAIKYVNRFTVRSEMGVNSKLPLSLRRMVNILALEYPQSVAYEDLFVAMKGNYRFYNHYDADRDQLALLEEAGWLNKVFRRIGLGKVEIGADWGRRLGMRVRT